MILCICLAVFQSAFIYSIQRGRMKFEFKSRKNVRDSQTQCFLTFFRSLAYLSIWQKLQTSYPERCTNEHIHTNLHSFKGILGLPQVKKCSNLQLSIYKWGSYYLIMTASLWGGRVRIIHIFQIWKQGPVRFQDLPKVLQLVNNKQQQNPGLWTV